MCNYNCPKCGKSLRRQYFSIQPADKTIRLKVLVGSDLVLCPYCDSHLIRKVSGSWAILGYLPLGLIIIAQMFINLSQYGGWLIAIALFFGVTIDFIGGMWFSTFRLANELTEKKPHEP